jgi:predicted Rossmann fold nucleotide-binding protein DprA/Smf involved in DNA uptake
MKQDIKWLGLRALVVEAAEKRGALITTNFNLEQGREVFAILGNITLLKSRSINSLIKAGAKFIDSPEPILEELLLPYGESLKSNKETIEPELDNDQERFFFFIIS